MIYSVRRFSDNASAKVLQEAKTSGVIQKVGDSWRIVSLRKGKLWNPHYETKKKAQAALRAYQANK